MRMRGLNILNTISADLDTVTSTAQPTKVFHSEHFKLAVRGY